MVGATKNLANRLDQKGCLDLVFLDLWESQSTFADQTELSFDGSSSLDLFAANQSLQGSDDPLGGCLGLDLVLFE